MILIVAIIAIALVVGYRRYRKSTTLPVPPGPTNPATGGTTSGAEAADAAVPTFEIVSLGLSGAGKTVFLASMFHDLYIRRPGRSYNLETDTDTRVTLAHLHAQLAGSTAEWPRGTQIGETRQFVFNCVVRSGPEKHTVMRLSYLDYAGELLERTQKSKATELHNLEQRIAHAHALFGVIDGSRLVQYLRGDPQGLRYMNGSIKSMVGLMAQAMCPIHFIVTKWDVVRHIGETSDDDEARLQIVRQALHDHADIGDLVRDTNLGRRTVRLIPVSALGNDFARLDDQGRMVKIAGATAQPYNLDLPMSAVVPDYFNQLESMMTDEDRLDIRSRSNERVGLPLGDSIRSVTRVLSAGAKTVIAVVLNTTVAAIAAEAVVDLYLDWVSRPVIRDTALGSKGRETAEARRARQLRAGVLDEFEKAIWNLENRLPSSVLRQGSR